MQFPQPNAEESSVYLEETDRVLPTKLNSQTRYAFFKTIARGGKSIIQSCKDLHLGRIICYKELRKELADNDVERQRFVREARVTAMLQHPSTVPVYELGRNARGHLYFTMKLVHGYTLRELIKDEYRDRYDLTQLVDVVLQTAQGLAFAHAHGVVHRDIKPENILVGPFGEVLLLDWGLAKVWDREGVSPDPPETEDLVKSSDVTITHQGKLEGTAAYMSPEQIRREDTIDGRTDIFSLGTVLYEILAGVRPTKGDTIHKVLQSALEDEATKPSEISKYQVPERLEDICMWCIRKDPDRRIQTAAQLVRELQEKWI